jgi:hypothetical protein
MNELTAQELSRILAVHSEVMNLHIKALAAHCECLGMNAENCQRAILGQSIAYRDDAFLNVMFKWGLTTEKGDPII